MGSSILIHIQNICDKLRGKVYRKILKKRQKKASMRLSNRVIMSQRSKSKCHHHVKEPRAFGKAQAWGVLLTTPCGRCLTKTRQKLVSGHSPKTFTTGVVKMRYPQNVQYFRYKIQGNYDMCTSKCSGKLRYRGIDVVYIGVKVLYKHDGTPQGTLKKRFLALSPNDSMERSVSKILQDNLALRKNATFLKVLREALSSLLIMESNMEGRDGIRGRR